MNLRKKVKLPTTINKFLKLHIADILGGVNIFRSKIIKFIADNCLDENLTKSKEDNWYENWKGLGKSETATDYDSASDYINVSNKVERNDSVSVSENHIDFDFNTNLPESKSNQNDSVITFEKHDDHNYSASFKEKNNNINNKNHCLNTISVENHFSFDAELSNIDVQIGTDTIDNSILNISSSTLYFENENNENKNTPEFLTLKQYSEPLSLA
ncbi:hypothetical protein PV328_012252, partial [Microctonus aethiopoides]